MSNVTEYELLWSDITISIIHTKRWSTGGIDHIEIQSIAPERAPLPITETGYRSHFHHEEQLSDYSDPKAYVLAWLDHEASSNEWKAYIENQQQLSLF